MNTTAIKGKTLWCAALIGALWATAAAGENTAAGDYARERLAKADRSDVAFRVVPDLGHEEAFRVTRDKGKLVVEHQAPAGALYGAQAAIRDEYESGTLETPDFDIRGTTLWLGGAVQGRRILPYYSGFSSQTLPWFFDRAFMTRYLDQLADARFNTLFLWASHPFPYILDLPDYPGATKLKPEQLRENQDQFRWLVSECNRRNIRVLLHFYNIHLPDGLREKFGAQKSWGSSALKIPTPEVADYYRYVLGRYFEEFDNVGLYICPGETLDTGHQLRWFRDVIFKAAKESGKNPLLVIRDWTLNMDFRDQIPTLYENSYSELKHNDETFTSPVPDLRHEQWRGLLKGHIVNLHGPPMDLQPMRWASPPLIRETVANWRDMGYVKGAEIYALSCFDWPYTQDKLTPDQSGYREQVKGPKLLWIDRSGIYLDAFGRYLWNSRRDNQGEQEYWQQYLARKFKSPQAGQRLHDWYVSSGPISPGLQNLTATKFGNFWATVMLQNQGVDQILQARKRIDDVPITLTREAGRTRQVYYSRPVDAFFFQRYKERYGLPGLTERISMPVAQYAEALSSGRQVTEAMTPDKVCDLLCELADEALKSARKAQEAATDPQAVEELGRFVTDSEMYVLATRALRHKVAAAILKARLLKESSDPQLGDEFLQHMEQSVVVYEQLAQLTDQTYRNGNDLMGRHWNREGLAEFRKDLAAQKKWLAAFWKPKFVTLPGGGIRIEAEWMAGDWRIGTEKYAGFEGSGYAAALQDATAPMTARIKLDAGMTCTVSVRALKGGAHQDRALAVEVAGKRLKTTHQGDGPAAGEYTWEQAGTVELPAGTVEIKVYPVGKGHPTADAILLKPAEG